MTSSSSYRTPYEVLGLSPGASRADVKEAYRRLCLQYHPDLCSSKDARMHSERAFKEISAAYSALTKGSGVHTSNPQTGPGGPYYRYSSAYHTHTRGGVGKFSNGVLAAVLAAPLVIVGYMLQRKKDEMMSIGNEMKIRPYGFFHPPVNPYLRDDLKPRTAANKWFGDSSNGSGHHAETHT